MGTSQPRSSIERGADGIMVRAMLVALASLLSSSAAFSAAPLVPSTGTGARVVVNMMAMGSLEISKPDEKEISGQAMRDWLPKTAKEPYSERLPPGALRFVFEGRGTVSAGPDGEPLPVSPSTLVEVQGDEVELVWTPDPSSGDFQVNSPEYWTSERIAARNLLPIATPILSGAAVLALVYSLVEGS